MIELTFDQVQDFMRGKTVAVVGSGPSVLQNDTGFIDSHDVVLRVNNYKRGMQQGFRTDIHYSFYGHSIKKASGELRRDGVQICMCKCPDDKPIKSPWHERNGRLHGIDFRYIYKARAAWWFCPVYIPDSQSFRQKFELLECHIPTTGFSAILDVISCAPKSIYVTGFDFFSSGVHNVDEPWSEKNTDDPISHRPDLEIDWLCENAHRYPLTFDASLRQIILARRSGTMSARAAA